MLELISDFSHLSHLRLRGLMAIPKAHNETESVRPSFQRLRELFNRAAELGLPHWDTLSMGMSADYRIAIEEGATEIPPRHGSVWTAHMSCRIAIVGGGNMGFALARGLSESTGDYSIQVADPCRSTASTIEVRRDQCGIKQPRRGHRR